MRPSPSLLGRRFTTSVFHHWLSPTYPHSRHAIPQTLFRPGSAVTRGPSSFILHKTIGTHYSCASAKSHPAPHTDSRRTLTASSGAFVTFVVFLGIGLGLGWTAVSFRRKRASDLTDLSFLEEKLGADSMSGEIAPGRPGNLTPEQEEKLRRLWQLIFQVCGVRRPENGTEAADAAATPAPTPASPEKTKKGRLSIFRRGRKDSEGDATPAPAGPAASVVLTQPKDGEDDKYGQTKHFYDTLASQTPESIRTTIWSMVKHDHPDALVLRFLRARKWDVEKALVMLVSTMNWRAQEMRVDDEIMRNGDAAAAEAEKDTSDLAKQRLGHDFLQQARMGKSFIHGTDKSGRPICYVRARLHKQGEQLEESLEKYTVYVIETCRYLLQPPVDTAASSCPSASWLWLTRDIDYCFRYDWVFACKHGESVWSHRQWSPRLTGTQDYTPVKFMIKCFEANYPESLGAVLVHKAPWVFQGVSPLENLHTASLTRYKASGRSSADGSTPSLPTRCTLPTMSRKWRNSFPPNTFSRNSRAKKTGSTPLSSPFLARTPRCKTSRRATVSSPRASS